MSIHPTAIIEDGAEIDPSAVVGPYCSVGPNVHLGAEVRLISHVVVSGNTTIGDRTQVFPFAVLGAPPQHLGYKGEDTRLLLGEDNIIREHVTMNPGTVTGRSETRVGSRGLFMTGSHVAHDCIVGDNVVFANNATLGGHVTVEDFVFMGGLCAVHQHCRIGSYSFVGGCAAVPSDVIPYGSVIGNHAHLAGLNIVGMRRRKMERAAINDIRAAYRLLFAQEGTFQERIEDVAVRFGESHEVMRIIDFIRAEASRPLCLPND